MEKLTRENEEKKFLREKKFEMEKSIRYAQIEEKERIKKKEKEELLMQELSDNARALQV